MTKAERDELAKLVRRREKLAKSDVDRIAAERLADFEQQMATIYKPADDPVWAELHAAAEVVVAEANRKVLDRCRDLGIPDRASPGIQSYWYGRGENADAKRREELRKVAKARIAADAQAAKTAIERKSVDVQTTLVAGGLVSAEAKAFLDTMPTADALMPGVTVAEIEAAVPMAGAQTGAHVR